MNKKYKIELEKEESVQKGGVFRIDIPQIPVGKFAEIILMLTNNKSSRKEITGLLDIRTVEESNIIYVTATYGDESRTEEQVIGFLKRIVSSVTDDEYEVIKTDDIEIVNVWHILLEESGIVKDSMDCYVVGD